MSLENLDRQTVPLKQCNAFAFALLPLDRLLHDQCTEKL